MQSPYEAWIGRRYVRSRSSNSFVSLISLISILGIAIAVAVLIVVLSVVNGFERELKERLLAMTAHASIEGAQGELTDWESLVDGAPANARVTAAAPYLDGQALMVFGEALSGVELRGVDPAAEAAVSGVDEVFTEGALGDLEPGRFRIALGVELANELGVAIGDKVTVTLAEGVVTPAGLVPRTKRLTVSGNGMPSLAGGCPSRKFSGHRSSFARSRSRAASSYWSLTGRDATSTSFARSRSRSRYCS